MPLTSFLKSQLSIKSSTFDYFENSILLYSLNIFYQHLGLKFIIFITMKSTNLELISLLFLLVTLGFASNSTNVTYAPPPQINSTLLFTLNDSAVGGQFIGSKRIQSLELSTTVVNSSLTTIFTINFFNRTAPNNLNRYSLNQLGNWTYVTGTRETLSCNLVYEYGSQTFGLLQFLSDIGSFKMLALAPISVFPSNITQLISNIPLKDISNSIFLGQNCLAGYFTSSVMSGLYQLTSDYTSLSIIKLPAGFSLLSVTQSFQYGIANSILYKLDPFRGQYNQIYSFPNSDYFTITAAANRIIITAANSTLFNNSFNNYTQYSINETIYFFLDDPLNNLTLLGTKTVSGTNYNVRFDIYYSPQLTKMGFGYTPLNLNTTLIVAKSIDYANKQVNDLVPQDFTHFLTTMSGTTPNEFDFSDYYMVARNTSNKDHNPTGQVVEEAYQFVGNQIVFFRARNLTSDLELTKFNKTFVDPFYTSKLVVLDVYSVLDNLTNSTIGFSVIQNDYGSLASMSVIVPQPIPPYINFTVPASTATYNSPTSFEWTYNNINGSASSTTLSLFRADSSAPNNIANSNFTINGSWSQVAKSGQCELLKDSSNNYILYKSLNSTYVRFADLTSVVSSLGVNSTSVWRVSQNCDRFSVDKHIFSSSQANQTLFQPITNNLTAFVWTSIDNNLTTAVVGSAVWRYNAGQNNFVQLFDTSTTIIQTNNVMVLPGVVVITATSNISAQVLAFSVSTTGYPNICLNYSVAGFRNPPKIQLSQNLTKVLIIGPFSPANGSNSSTVNPRVDMFFIDYANIQNQNITFPLSTIIDPLYTYMSLNEQFLYIRQLQNPNVSYNASLPNQEFIYYLSQNIYPQVASTSNISSTLAQIWTKTLVQTTPNGNSYIMEQTLQGNASTAQFVVVTQRQVTASQANLNSNSNQGVTGYMVNGQIKLCPPGCSDCSSGTCTSCMTGFAFDSSASICYTCGLNCINCVPSNPNNCSSCMAGAYLSSNTCLPCSTTCITCSGSANSCSQCPPGQYFQSNQCALCPNNCNTCSSQNICNQCNNGFALTSNGVCRSCIATCSSCSPSNITQCTSCAHGLQLSGGSCIQCPQNCLSCNNGICATCISGYTPNAIGVCVLNCQLPCATCIENQPQACLSCYGGSALINNICNINLSCNNDSSCTDCGQGLNYILIASQCLPCTQIPNCLQCSVSNSQICSICALGYFINGASGCNACPTQCISCTSSNICTGCVVGYTLPDGQTQGQCLQCQSPCLSCIGSPTYCASCETGFTKQGWKCRNNTYVGFTIVLGDTPANILASIDSIVTALLTILKENSTNVQAITFNTISSGSTVMVGSYASSTLGVSTGASLLTTTLSSGSLAGFSVNSASVTSYVNGNSASQSSSSSSSTNIGLIVGLAIGLPAAVIIIIIFSYFLYQKSKRLPQVIQEHIQEVPFHQIDNNSSLEIQYIKNPHSQVFRSNAWQKQMAA